MRVGRGKRRSRKKERGQERRRTRSVKAGRDHEIEQEESKRKIQRAERGSDRHYKG